MHMFRAFSCHLHFALVEVRNLLVRCSRHRLLVPYRLLAARDGCNCITGLEHPPGTPASNGDRGPYSTALKSEFRNPEIQNQLLLPPLQPSKATFVTYQTLSLPDSLLTNLSFLHVSVTTHHTSWVTWHSLILPESLLLGVINPRSLQTLPTTTPSQRGW